MYLALKEIKKEKTRFLMIILVTVLIAYLVYFLSSLAYGLQQLNRTAIDHWNATGIITSKASNENIYASAIDLQVVDELGLSSTDAINVTSTTVGINGDENQPIDLIFMGFDLSAPNRLPKLVDGAYPQSTQEVVISQNIRDEQQLLIGDSITVLPTGRVFEIVGFTIDSNYNTRPVAYVDQAMASTAMMTYTTGDSQVDAVSTPTPNMPNRVSAILTNETISQSLLDEYGLQYNDIPSFINLLPGYQAQILTFGLMIVSLAVIAAIIIGIFMYILTMQKRPIFGVLRIQGFKNSYIVSSVIIQTILVILMGYATGLLLTMVTIAFIPTSVPVAINWSLFGVVTGFSLVCSLIGSFFSSLSILKIDPLQAL